MLLSDRANAGKRTSPEQAADRANGQPIGREHEARIVVRTVHPRLGREPRVISGGFGNKSDHQLGGSRRIAGEKFRRAVNDEQPEVRAPEFSDKPADNFTVPSRPSGVKLARVNGEGGAFRDGAIQCINLAGSWRARMATSLRRSLGGW